MSAFLALCRGSALALVLQGVSALLPLELSAFPPVAAPSPRFLFVFRAADGGARLGEQRKHAGGWATNMEGSC